MTLRNTSRILKALADPTRLRIVALLAQRPFCVCELTVALGLSQPTVSRHLQQLEAEGFLEAEKEGPWVIYRLAPRNERAQGLVDLILPWLLSDSEMQELVEKARGLNRRACSSLVRSP